VLTFKLDFVAENAKGSALGTRKLLKKLDQNFYCIGLLKLHVVLGRTAAKRLSVSAKHTRRQRKLAFFSAM